VNFGSVTIFWKKLLPPSTGQKILHINSTHLVSNSCTKILCVSTWAHSVSSMTACCAYQLFQSNFFNWTEILSQRDSINTTLNYINVIHTAHHVHIIHLLTNVYAPFYTGCHRRNGPNFGRVFFMLKYTDITQNTYIQSW